MKNAITIFISLIYLNMNSQEKQVFLIVGTYTDKCKSDGIYIFRFNSDTAEYSSFCHSENVISPSFLSIADNENFIYSVNENGDQSTISAFKFDRGAKTVKLVNSKDSHGASPCYITEDSQNIIVANYGGGSIAVFEKSADGSIGNVKQVVRHHGNGPNRERQEKPHMHMAVFSPDHEYVLVNDLGIDKIVVYRYDPKSSDSVLTRHHEYVVKAGSGPRHLDFSPDGKFVYLLHELDGTLTTFAYREGTLEKIDETTIVQDGFGGKIGAADIHTSPDGKFLYATNRGDANTISVFAIDKGKPSHVETIATKGKGPRNFAIVPGGKFLLVAHQDSNDIVIFSRNEATGKLTDTGKTIQLCAPVCLKFSN